MSTKIAVVTETWPPEVNGVALTIQKMVSGMLSRGYKIDLYRLSQKQAQPTLAIEGFREHVLPGFSLPWYQEVRVGFPAIRSFKKHWQTHRPDVIQIVTEGPLGWAAMHTARRMNIPVISEFHTNFDQYSQYYHFGLLLRLASRYLRWFHNQSGLTLVPTQEIKNSMQKAGFKHLEVVSRGIDIQQFNPMQHSEALRRQWGLIADQLAVVHVGRLAKEKNLSLAVKAFRAIQTNQPDAKMVLVGDGPARASLEKENPDFIFCGMQKGRSLARHYASGDLFLSPSSSETFGNVTLEAMASGLAIVCFDYAAAKEHIINGVHALSVPLGHDSDFIEAAVTLANDYDLRADLSQAAVENVQPVSWERVIDVFENHVMSLTGEKNPDRHTKVSIDSMSSKTISPN